MKDAFSDGDDFVPVQGAVNKIGIIPAGIDFPQVKQADLFRDIFS